MKIIDYDKYLDKKKIANSAYKICGNADFPVTYQDVYDHLFKNAHSILKLLLNEENRFVGFGVFETYRLFLENQILTMLYLSGMVVDPKYQGRNISSEIIKNTYKKLQTDFISLRTQNIAMAKSLLNTFKNSLIVMPNQTNDRTLNCLRQASPFKNMNEFGVIRNCYPKKLYSNLNAIQNYFGIKLQTTDALGVVIEPSKNKQKVLSRFN